MTDTINFEVLRLERKHLEDVAALEADCFSEPWSRQSLELLVTEQALGAVVCCNGRAVAYGGMMTVLDEGQITNVAVLPAYRRQGLGRAVLEKLCSLAEERGLRELSLEVRISNLPAISMYEQNGFVIAGKRRGFYRDPLEDAYVMLKSL